MFTANNFYRLTTATSIPNSGTGSNALTKPAGVEVASVVPGRKYSVYIPSAATFSTSFNVDTEGYTIWLYTKPEPGVVISVDGNEVVFTGYSYTMSNTIGQSVEIPVRSNAVRLVALTYSDMEISLSVDGVSETIDSNITTAEGPVTVTVLSGGGIVDHITAKKGVVRSSDIETMVSLHKEDVQTALDTTYMFDTSRDNVQHRVVLEEKALMPGENHWIGLRANEVTAFKLEYEKTGDIVVIVNGVTWESGMGLDEIPDSMDIYSETGGVIRNVIISEYDDPDLTGTSNANFTTDSSSGTPAPTHRHDDAAANDGNTVVTIQETANTLAGWFKVQDGTPLPDVTMAAGVLSGTGLYVNGRAYSGQALRDWYFLTKTGAVTGEFTSTVPTHALYASEETLTAAQIDDLYESFFGNPTLTANSESLTLTDGTGMIISTEWNIVASG